MTEPKEYLSSAWAISHELSVDGTNGISHAMVFGLGSSAWYHLEQVDSEDTACVLRFVHPGRLGRAFSALNLYAACFNILTYEATEHLMQGVQDGGRAMIVVDRFALPSQMSTSHERITQKLSLDYTMLVEKSVENAAKALLALRGPLDKEAQPISRDELEKAWFYQRGSGRSATFTWYQIRKAEWEPEEALPLALRRQAIQMLSTHSSLGATGLRALGLLLERLDGGDHSVLISTAHCALADGGLSLCRNMQAEFMREAGTTLKLPRLLCMADKLDLCGTLWREILEDAVSGVLKLPVAIKAIREILSHERDIASDLTRLSMSLLPTGVTCHA